MNKKFIVSLSCLVLLMPLAASAQNGRTHADLKKTPTGISWQAWEKMNTRWQHFSTRVNIQKKDGSGVEGQLVWMAGSDSTSDSAVILQNNFDLPNGLMNPEDLTTIPVGEIASMKVKFSQTPYMGLITGLVVGAIPGVIGGMLLGGGWSLIPAFVLGAAAGGGGGFAGSAIQRARGLQNFDLSSSEMTARNARKIKRSAIFPDDLPTFSPITQPASLPDFEKLVQQSPALGRAFPVNPYTLSFHSSIMTNSIRKRMQNWYMSPLWGPPDTYFETRIGIEADLSRRIGKTFQAGIMFQFFPDDISSTSFSAQLPEYNVSYNYGHRFNQTTFGIYGGWLIQPADRYHTSRLETSIQLGAVISDVTEHFYLYWNNMTDYDRSGETSFQENNFQPGAMMRIKSSLYVIPGLSIDTGIEGFWIKKIHFDDRTVLPETAYGPQYITQHSLNFSNIQAFLGFSIHF